MLAFNAYSGAGQVLTVGNNVVYNTNDVTSISPAITHTAGTAGFNLNCPGIYHVTATVTMTATAEGNTEMVLMNDGTAVVGTLSENVAAAADDPISFVMDKIIRIPPSCAVVDNRATITAQVTVGGGTLVDANMAIEKIA